MKLPYLLPLLAVAAAHAEEKTDLAAAGHHPADAVWPAAGKPV